MIAEVERYKTKCMKDLPKQTTGILLFSFKNAIKQFCNKDSKKLTILIASSPCINKANPQINICYTTLIDKILGAQNANDTKKIPHTCCEYYKFFSCIETRTERIIGCTEAHITITIDFIRSLTGITKNN
jgi:hypothetical protein